MQCVRKRVENAAFTSQVRAYRFCVDADGTCPYSSDRKLYGLRVVHNTPRLSDKTRGRVQ